MKSIFGNSRNNLRLLQFASFIFLFGALLAFTSGVFGQSSGEDWFDPINLSQSAGANNPRAVVDSLGRSHIFWTNSTNSFVYTRQNGEGYAQPTLVEVPFGTRRFDLELSEVDPTPLYVPKLFSDQVGNIYALWRDNETTLFQSRVNADQVQTFEAWSAPQQVAEAALEMDLDFSISGLSHLVYIRPLDSAQFPAGVYYRQSNNGGATWSAPVLLFHSPYFQALDTNRADVQVTSTAANQVIVSWEDPFQEKLFAIHSGNGGTSWEPVIEVDQRLVEDGLDSLGPGQSALASVGDSVHLLWQAGHQGANCEIYHQSSPDGGQSWSSKEVVLGTIPDCISRLSLVDYQPGSLIALIETEGGTYLAVWDGIAWSEPSYEQAITTFANPLTFREIILSCKQPVIVGAGTDSSAYQLSILGCESQSNRDIWLRSAELSSLLERIAPSVDAVWQSAVLLNSAANIGGLELVGDIDGQLHAFWSQKAQDVEVASTIFYGVWDGASWSSVREILASPDGLSAVSPSVIFDSPDKLSAVWAAGEPGEILFSQAAAANASVPAEWSIPVVLPFPRQAVTNPDIVKDQEGLLYVASAIPLNENRGIYVTVSLDGGDNWLEPVLAFDAAESSWDMVDNSRLAIGTDGTLHLTWIRYSSPPLSEPMSLAYTRSADGGLTWSEADELALGNILWSDQQAIGDRLVHRFWYVEGEGIWHETSIDAGLTWGQRQPLPGSQGVSYPVDATLDGAGRPHVAAIEIIQEPGRSANEVLRHWTWADDRWVIEESHEVAGNNIAEITSSSTVDGKFAVMYSTHSGGTQDDGGQLDLYVTNRDIDLPENSSAPLPTLTPQPTAQPTARPTETPAPTPTVFFPTQPNEDGGLSLPVDTSNPFIGPLVGIIPAAIVIFVAFFIVVRIVRGDRR